MNRSHRPHTVLFDWDGTLLDSYTADARAYLALFRALGIPWTKRDLARHYSPDWHRIYRAVRLPRRRWDEADRLWRAAYQKESPRLLPGARRVLRTVGQQFVLGLVSGGSRDRVRRQVEEFGLSEAFRVCICCEDARRRKPHPAALQLALQRLACDPEECVYVGDTAEDVLMARRAGIRCIGVRGPFPTAQALRRARPERLLGSITGLPKALSAAVL